jgi:glutamine synthetase
MGVGAPTSGATWAPAYATYGMNNRTQAIRIPAPGRIEIRCVDGSANPYLAAAALIGCGLDGIEHDSNPGEPNLDNLYTLTPEQIRRKRIKTLPANLLDAVRAAEKCKPLRDWLGEMDGRSYLDYFCEVKRAEWQEYHTEVSDWELRRYLTLF